MRCADGRPRDLGAARIEVLAGCCLAVLGAGCGPGGGLAADGGPLDSAFLDLAVTAQTGVRTLGVTVDEGIAYGRDSDSGDLRVWDLSSADQIVDLHALAEDAAVTNYVHDGELWGSWDTIRRWDISGVPAQAPALSQTVDGLNAGYLLFHGDRLYVADRMDTVEIFDLTAWPGEEQVSNPEHLGAIRFHGLTGWSMLPEGDDLLWLGTSRDGVLLVDVADPAAPALVHRLDQGGIVAMARAGDLLWVSTEFDLRGWDVSDPYTPVFMASSDLTGGGCLAARDGWLHACGDGGFSIFDIHDPAAMLRVRQVLEVSAGDQIHFVDEHIAVGGGAHPLTLLAPNDPGIDR
ncbi:MAG: hypothetical protein ABIO70_13480 [Pseudomonadota bacterium]